jgi:hypothetical protein
MDPASNPSVGSEVAEVRLLIHMDAEELTCFPNDSIYKKEERQRPKP